LTQVLHLGFRHRVWADSLCAKENSDASQDTDANRFLFQ
jgi:hypothetical protein